jgi:hypothetical protein
MGGKERRLKPLLEQRVADLRRLTASLPKGRLCFFIAAALTAGSNSCKLFYNDFTEA